VLKIVRIGAVVSDKVMKEKGGCKNEQRTPITGRDPLMRGSRPLRVTKKRKLKKKKMYDFE